MSLFATCYAQPGKPKSRLLLEAFARGAPGPCSIAETPPARLSEGAAAFYGVVDANAHLWREAREAGRDWYWVDNAYFDRGRGSFYRVTRNALQADGRGRPDWRRFAALGVGIQPWRKGGEHVLVVEQSEDYLRLCCGFAPGAWLEETVCAIARATDRPVMIRRWSRDKRAAMADLGKALEGCWALVTHTSAAANEALAAGVPAFCTGACAASPLASADVWKIESPERPDGRAEWAAALAGAQWTVDELRLGAPWTEGWNR